MTAERTMTVEEFERIAPLLDGPSELVDGRLRLMSPTGFAHGVLALRIGAALERYAEDHPEVGEAVGAETGFRIDDPHHPVQAPDAAFVGVNRMPAAGRGGRNDPALRFVQGAPDLAVEVRSPDDTRAAMRTKARRWLNAGCHEVWLLDGQHETVEIWRPDQEPIHLTRGEILTSNTLPGFQVELGRLFRRRTS